MYAHVSVLGFCGGVFCGLFYVNVLDVVADDSVCFGARDAESRSGFM